MLYVSQQSEEFEAGGERPRHSTRLLACCRKGHTGQNFRIDGVAMTVRVGRKHAPCIFAVMRVEPRRQPKCLLAELLRCILDSAKVDFGGRLCGFRCNGPLGVKNAPRFGLGYHNPMKASGKLCA
jgi:hypothetical protein